MSLREDLITASAWIGQALQSSGYKADFSASSLWELERFFDDHAASGKPLPGGLLAENLGARLFALGAYLGDVVVRHVGGEWICDDDDPRGEINVQLRLASGLKLWPVQRVMRRLQSGPAESLTVYAASLGVQVGPRPAHFPNSSLTT